VIAASPAELAENPTATAKRSILQVCTDPWILKTVGGWKDVQSPREFRDHALALLAGIAARETR
jgi:hypothetical protein